MANKGTGKDNIIDTNLKPYEPEQAFDERKIVSTSEKGKTYRIDFSQVKPSAVYAIDGVIIKEGNRCDKLVLVQMDIPGNNWLEVFVELKGTDVNHAIEQLKATVDKPVFKHDTISQRKARIVAQSFPRSNGSSSLERARNYFRKKNIDFKCGSVRLVDVM